MSIQEKLKTARECSGKTFQELADKNGITKQAYQQKLFSRMVSMKKLIAFTDDIGFKLVAKSPNGDIAITFVREDFKE